MLVRARGSKAQAVALVDGWLAELARDRARAASLHLDLGFFAGFRLLFGFRLSLGFPLEPRGVFGAGLSFGLLCRETLCGLVGSR
jgi:hypothetical protein